MSTKVNIYTSTQQQFLYLLTLKCFGLLIHVQTYYSVSAMDYSVTIKTSILSRANSGPTDCEFKGLKVNPILNQHLILEEKSISVTLAKM